MIQQEINNFIRDQEISEAIQEHEIEIEKIILEVRNKFPKIEENFYLVGSWLWCEFEKKPSEEIRKFLKDSGFKWNQKRNVWQNGFGQKTRKSYSDPRGKYFVQDLQELKI